MPDDDRTRRRLGDETKGRIADLASGWDTPPIEKAKAADADPQIGERIAELASGWSVEAAEEPPILATPAVTPAATPAAASPTAPPPLRKKPKSLPPPPPGSKERLALEAAIVDAKDTGPAPRSEVAKPTSPPPLPAMKSGATAKPPSAVRSGPTETGTVDVSGVIGGMTPSPVLIRPKERPALPGTVARAAPPAVAPTPRADTTDRTGPSPAMPSPPPAVATPSPDAVPRGEFEHDSTLLEQDKMRIAYEQSTIKRDVANAVLGLPEQPLTVVKPTPVEVLLTESAEHIRGDPTNLDPQTEKFERGNPTLGPDSTSIDPPVVSSGAGGRLRAQAALRRKRGIGGDVRYVATALFGVRRARREVAELELQQITRQKSRTRHLLTLGRTAVITEGYDHPALNRAREQLAVVEDERAQHTAAVAAADSELMRVRTDRAEKAKAYQEGLVACDSELAEIAKKLEPLEKEVQATAHQASKLHESLRRIDAQIAATEASKVTVRGSKSDPAAIQAELASLKADRLAVERDEPKLAAELDSLNPRVAALESRRTEARKRRLLLDEEEHKDQHRMQELLAAIGAKRVVVDRAAADAEASRDKTLLELGERIYHDRPDNMSAQLSPIDTIDVELGTTDRRMMELREIMSSVDRAKVARGLAVIILSLTALGSFVAWFVYAFL